jgi:hypothetical protein
MRKRKSKPGADTVTGDDLALFYVHNRLHALDALRRETCLRCHALDRAMADSAAPGAARRARLPSKWTYL